MGSDAAGQPILPGATNVADCVRLSAQRDGDAVALVHGRGPSRREITWAALDADVGAAAAGFRRGLGLHAGSRVALVLGNTPAFVTAYFGLLRAGLVAVPFNTGCTSPELSRMLEEAGAHVVLCDDQTAHVVDEAVAGTHRVVVDLAGLDSVVAAGRAAGPLTAATAGGEDLAALMFTPGTSGRPRAAMLPHRALLANQRQCLALDPAPMAADDVVLLVLPLFHIFGLNAALGLAAATGARCVLAEQFDPRATLEVVRDEGVTNIPGDSPMYVAWSALVDDRPDGPDLAEALRGVRLLAFGAAPLPPSVRERLLTRTTAVVNEGYGRTETSPVISSTVGCPRVKPGSVGRPPPGVDIRLVDELGSPVDDEAPGEIQVRGDNLFTGYWPEGCGGPDAEGWWATGDVAAADEDGDLFLVEPAAVQRP